MRMSNLTSTFYCLALCAALAGCGSSKYSGDQRYPLEGEVTFEGEPIDMGSITFTPEGDKGRVSGGVITNGKYAVPEENGANAGTYRVKISWLKRTGRKLKDVESGEMYDERREAIPDSVHKDSELTVEVPLPDNRHDFKLKAG
jgi:hypothetical protein